MRGIQTISESAFFGRLTRSVQLLRICFPPYNPKKTTDKFDTTDLGEASLALRRELTCYSKKALHISRKEHAMPIL